MKSWKLINCDTIADRHISGSGIFGLQKELILKNPQKVYLRASVEIKGIARVTVGIVDGDTAYSHTKAVRSGKSKSISVIHNCKKKEIKAIIIIESYEKKQEVCINDIIIETIGMSGVSKFTLDKIAYKENDIENLYCGSIGKISTTTKKRQEVDCNLQNGERYLFKVLYDEITDCGTFELDCGNSKEHQKKQMVREFIYAGRKPAIVLTANKFTYMVEIKAIVIAPAASISKEEFAKIEYWR